MTKCTICDKEFQNIGAHMKVHEEKGTSTPGGFTPEAPGPAVQNTDVDKLMEMMQTVVGAVGEIRKRVDKIETGGANNFKDDAKPEDVESASAGRVDIDPRIVKIVNEMLGEDFGIDIGTHADKPGFLFTLVVPQRLSAVEKSLRPVLDDDGVSYKKLPSGETMMEEYYPEDRRSREISSTGSFDTIKAHCEKVRANIVAYYQKTNKPLPEFKVK